MSGSPLPEPEPEVADRRRRRLTRTIKRLGVFALGVGALAALYIAFAENSSVHAIVATFILAAGSVMMAGVLMSLIYYSNQSGHDARAATHDPDPWKDD